MGWGCCCCVNRAAELDWAASFSFPTSDAAGWEDGGVSPHPPHGGSGEASCIEALSSPLTTAFCPNTCTWEHLWFCTQDGSHKAVASAIQFGAQIVPMVLCIFSEGPTGAPLTASCISGPSRVAWNILTASDTLPPAPHTHPGPHFPDFIQWHVHSGDGGRHKVGPDLSWSPGGTTHHALRMGRGTGRLGGPSRSLCTREEAVSAWVPLAQAHNGRG